MIFANVYLCVKPIIIHTYVHMMSKHVLMLAHRHLWYVLTLLLTLLLINLHEDNIWLHLSIHACVIMYLIIQKPDRALE